MSKKRKQCKKCPWKVSTNPYDIPGGYCVKKHESLLGTVPSGNTEEQLLAYAETGVLRMMACHETANGNELPCVGWLDNQIEAGNIALRLAVMVGRVNADYELVGEQHATLEDTLPGEKGV